MDDARFPASADLARLRGAVRAAKHAPEDPMLQGICARLPLDEADRTEILAQARAIVTAARHRRAEQGTMDAFLQEFGLETEEGVALMCLAEALLRVPDVATQDDLIAEKIRSGDWKRHLGHSENSLVNAGIWGLMLTGDVIGPETEDLQPPTRVVERLIARMGEPVIRNAVAQAMKLMGRQFVYGRTIEEALARRMKRPPERQLFSFDMLGEGARTAEAAQRYVALYTHAIEQVGRAGANSAGGPEARSSVSIKLSALHPRYEQAQEQRVRAELYPTVKALAQTARGFDMQMTIDAEEADRLDLSLSLIEQLAADPDLAGWNGLGLAVQAYQKRALPLIDWLADLARATGRQLPVRLVKGAYWDTEIKHAQVEGRPDYPVFTRKPATDVNYLACANRLLEGGDLFFPQFATHNAHTLSAILHMAEPGQAYEFQRLHGMGQLLYRAARDVLDRPIPARIYAPVGQHRDLLPYLVRRLLENGANSSFVNRFLDPDVPVEQVAEDPIETAAQKSKIVKPPRLYGPERPNSAGVDLTEPSVTEPLFAAIRQAGEQARDGACLVGGEAAGGDASALFSPVDRRQRLGTARTARPADRERAIGLAQAAQPAWDGLRGPKRAAILRAMADALEAGTPALLDLITREAGRTLPDAVSEIREAVDFCRYYAREAERLFGPGAVLPGPTGERNELRLHGRGVFLCISPWNFPLAIFTGQVAAALAAGNAVIAKPAEQTPLIAHRAVTLFHQAGVPADVLHLLLGDGPSVAAPLVADERVAGVAFTGSVDTAKRINRALAARDGAIVPLIAETGGQNAMVVDSTALHEQVVDDVLASAFGSAGQRCSACRVMMVHDKVADPLLDMLAGALAERRLGDPAQLSTDIGPIIDEAARDGLIAHAERMDKEARLVAKAAVPDSAEHGVFFAPRIYEIDALSRLREEVFGPVLHVLRYRTQDLKRLMRELADTGYGLTFGVHSRLEKRWRTLYARSTAGNVYINRNMVGAVVGVQPFGGAGLSGTGPKAGGPHYLPRFAVERVMTVNTAAIGGDTDLFRLAD
ncbi:MAG: bifunctional proline dehydrogenase/L-glutamate gamma-semialdehyde dehydrogenase PutA [Rhodothalassiaceae bacterium]